MKVVFKLQEHTRPVPGMALLTRGRDDPSSSRDGIKWVHNVDKELNHVKRERQREGENERTCEALCHFPVSAHFVTWPLFLAWSNKTSLMEGHSFSLNLLQITAVS